MPSVSQVSQFTLESTSLCAVSIQSELFFLIKKANELDADVCGVRCKEISFRKWKRNSTCGLQSGKTCQSAVLAQKAVQSIFLHGCQWRGACVWLQSATNPSCICYTNGNYFLLGKKEDHSFRILGMGAVAGILSRGKYQGHLQGDRYTLIRVRAERH